MTCLVFKCISCISYLPIDMSTEVDEIKYLISLAKHHGVINALNAYAATLPQQMDVDTASTECAPIDISPAPKINRELPIPQVAEAPRVEFVGAYTPITDFVSKFLGYVYLFVIILYFFLGMGSRKL